MRTLSTICSKHLFANPESFLTFYWIASLLWMKCFLIFRFCPFLSRTFLIWLPSFFLPEIYLILLVTCIKWTISKTLSSPNLKKVLRTFLMLSLVLTTSTIYTAAIASIYRVGFIISWSTAICAVLLLEADGGLLGSEVKPAAIALAVQLVVIALGIYFSRKRHDYELPAGFQPEEQAEKSIISKTKLILLMAVLCLYTVAAVCVNPGKALEPAVVMSPLWTFFKDVLHLLSNRCKEPTAKLYIDEHHQKWFSYCQNLNELIIQARSPFPFCSEDKPYVKDYSFVKRKPESAIKNVVIFFMESTRSEMMPFNYSSNMGRKLTAETLERRDITPFMDMLANKSIYSTNAKSISSYTIKSVIGALCSMYPLPRNYIFENRYNYYRTCLPKVLKKYGFATGFVQPMIVKFDNEWSLLKKMYIDYIYSAESMKKAHEYPDRPTKFINDLGFEDGPFLRPMMKWVDMRVRAKEPFLLAYSASATHSDFDTPPSWPFKTFTTENHGINKYLNAHSYMDSFIKNFTKEFEKRGLDKSTLFIFIGDHGVSLGEHNAWLTPEIPYESQFGIPIIIYSGNEKWQQRFPPKRVEAEWNTLDVVPTILDALNFDSEDIEKRDDYLYEGQSMLRKYENRVQLGLVNPGVSYIVVRENDRKIAFPDNQNKRVEIYDLKVDPNEEKNFALEEMSDELKAWADEMRFVRALYVNKTTEWYERGGGLLRAD